jgi:hypothetical protein
MRTFVTIKNFKVFGPSIRDSKVKYLVDFDEKGELFFYDPDTPEQRHTHICLLLEPVIDEKTIKALFVR